MKNLFLSITIIFTLISCKALEDLFTPPQYNYKYSFVSYSLLNGSKKLIKEDIIPPYYFFPVKSNDGNDRLFFFGSNCGYYDPNGTPTYFNFKSYNILVSKKRKWIIFKEYDYNTGDGNFFILDTSTLQIREINTKLSLYYYENNYGLSSERQNYSFSPDETKLVLSDSITYYGKAQLYIMDINTLTAGKILEIKIDNFFDRIQFLSPVFSSDGSKIFFSISYLDGFSADSINPKPGLYSINSDGTSLMAIDTVEQSIQIIRSAWSGELIFYSDYRNKLYKINEDGSGKINTGISYNKGPIDFRVSSSGSTIIWWNAFMGEGKDDNNIYLNNGSQSISIDKGFIVEFSQDENSVEYIQMLKL